MTVRYFDWMEFIWTTDLSPEAKLISAYLTRFMNKDKDIAWPSQARIMGETGLKKATLNRRLIELEDSGFLIRDSGNSKKTTRYILQVPNSLTERLLNNPTVSQGDHEQSHTETRVVSQGDSNISNTITPLINQKDYCASATQKAPNGHKFEDFWKIYPLKRNKKKSLEIWKRKNLDENAEDLIADVQNRIEHDNQWKSGFILHCTTYLNGHRWEDSFT